VGVTDAEKRNVQHFNSGNVTDVEKGIGTKINSSNAYPARAALLQSRRAARRIHHRISRDKDLWAAASKEVAEQQQRAKRALAGKESADFFDYLRALHEHAPPEEREAADLAERSRKTGDICGECGRALAADEHGYRGVTYVGFASLAGKPKYSDAVLCAACAPEYLVNSRPGSDGFHIFAHEPCDVCGRVIVARTTRGMWHRRRHVFCSERCEWTCHNTARNERAARAREKVCEVCGQSFTATRRDAKTCSPACKQKAYRRRRARPE
jgi:hypothetical protein